MPKPSRVVTSAKDAIDANLTLDGDKFVLSRLKRELVAILDRHEEKVSRSRQAFRPRWRIETRDSERANAIHREFEMLGPASG
jgi:hypothetical protein